MTNEQIQALRTSLATFQDSPVNRTKLVALCVEPMLWEMAEHHVPGLKQWDERQQEIAAALEMHDKRWKEGEDYASCRFKVKDLKDADLRGADLEGAGLEGANLECANLSEANLSEANLWYADLEYANLRGANLRGADLEDADLTGANLRGANLTGALYNDETIFPEGFDPEQCGMVKR